MTDNPKFTVYASREGLVGVTTSTGHVIVPQDMFVALPSTKVLHLWVNVQYGNKVALCPVLDVGPHSIHDDYWDRPTSVPLAVTGKSDQKPYIALNKSGIDLADGIYDGLGIPRSIGIAQVTWWFAIVDKDTVPSIIDITPT